MAKIIKDVLILFAITLVAGLALGYVFNVTKSARTEQEKKTLNEAYEKVMPGTNSTKSVKKPSDAKIKDIVLTNEKNANVKPYNEYKATINDAVKAFDKDGKELGYIITVTDEEAYGGSLQMTVGVDKSGQTLGISFLSLKETPGLGMNADTDSFKKQFKNKKVKFFVYTKTGAKDDNEIDAISSATVTTNAVTHGVNAAIACAQLLNGGGSDE